MDDGEVTGGGRWPGWLVALLCGVAILTALALANDPEYRTRPGVQVDSADAFEAYRQCTRLVADELVEPDTATFPEPSQANYAEVDDAWVIDAYVDAFNGVGALIRSNFTCEMEPTQRGWRGTVTELG